MQMQEVALTQALPGATFNDKDGCGKSCTMHGTASYAVCPFQEAALTQALLEATFNDKDGCGRL